MQEATTNVDNWHSLHIYPDCTLTATRKPTKNKHNQLPNSFYQVIQLKLVYLLNKRDHILKFLQQTKADARKIVYLKMSLWSNIEIIWIFWPKFLFSTSHFHPIKLIFTLITCMHSKLMHVFKSILNTHKTNFD